VRLIGLQLSATDLYVDEAQYWVWAQDPAWGYFSKPPLVAWLIAAAEPICGSGPACVRTPSVLIWAAIPMIIAAIGTTLGGRSVGLWAGLCALLAPGAAFSARVLSTDPPLLLFWSLALLAFVRLRAGGAGWGAVLAVGIGLGLLSKYAMAYFLGGLILAALVDPASRRALRRPAVWLGIVAGLAMLGPNLLWNLDNGLVTVRHTAENATDSGGALDVLGSLEQGLAFVAAQFGLAGPVVFAALLLAGARWSRLSPERRVMLAFSAPVFVAITIVALANGANANWAAAGLVGAFVLAPLVLSGPIGRRWLAGGLAFGAGVQVLLLVGDATADRVRWPGEPYEPVLGWSALSEAVARRAEGTGVRVIVAERRGDAAQLSYGLRNTRLQVRVWPAAEGEAPRDYFQMARPLTVRDGAPVMVVTECADLERFRQGWGRVEPLGVTTAAAGPGAERTYSLIGLDDPRAPSLLPGECPGA
jgi:4-amino-4-deoxy-L-arabinose transferase-like glycosyltransferase